MLDRAKAMLVLMRRIGALLSCDGIYADPAGWALWPWIVIPR